jgi:hypothetical protein
MTEILFPPGPVLMTVEARVDSDHEDEFNRWYDEQHIPDVVSCPKFLAGARYTSSDSKPRVYLALYVLEDETAVETPELKRVSGFGHLTHHVTYERRLFRPRLSPPR